MSRVVVLAMVLAACGGDDGESVGVDAGVDASVDAAPIDGPILTPFAVHEVGRLAVTDVEDLALSGSTLYALLGSTDVLTAIDVADPTAPVRQGTLTPANVSSASTHFAVAGNIAYLPWESDGLLLADVSDPAHLVERGRLTGVYAKDVAVASNLAYIADQDSGLVIAGVADPAHPVRRGAVATDGPFGVAVSGTTVALADNSGGLVVVDAANPAAPVIKASQTAYDGARTITAVGGTVYLLAELAGNDTLFALDLANPAQPARLGLHAADGDANLFVDAAQAYVVGDAVQVFDTEATALLTTITGDADTYATAAVADATHIYVAWQGDGVGAVVIYAKE